MIILQDIVDPVTDEMLAKFVVDSHFKSQPKGANMDDRSVSESHEDNQATARPVDTEVWHSWSYLVSQLVASRFIRTCCSAS